MSRTDIWYLNILKKSKKDESTKLNARKKSVILEIHPTNPQNRLIERVVKILRNDGVIVYPSDTSYGLGCSIFSKKALDRIYKIKQYGKTKKLSIICRDITDIAKYAFISDMAYRNMKRLSPGPYTWILPVTKEVPKSLHTNRKEIGIRIPDSNICSKIVEELGNPLFFAGAGNSEESLSGAEAYDLHDHYGSLVDLVIDGGILFDEPSTVIRADDYGIEVVREGLGKIDFLGR